MSAARNVNATQFGVTDADYPSESQKDDYDKKQVMGVFNKQTTSKAQPLDQDGGQAGS